jgi:predicted PurR-regulated permease PerM
LLLGILAGIFEFVPLLGPLMIGIIVTLVAAAGDNPWRALYVATFLIVLRVVHDYVTYPRIVRGGMHLHPLAIILAILAGEQIAGIPGVFLSIPIVAVITVIYRHILEHQGRSRGLVSGLIQEVEKPAEEIV